LYFFSCIGCFFFSSRRRHTISKRDWSSDVCSSDLILILSTFIFVNHFSFGVVSFLVSAILLALVYIYANKWLSLSEENLRILADHIAKGKEYTVDHMPIGMVMLNDDDEIIWMNEYMQEHMPQEYYNESINTTFPHLLT